MMETMMEQEQTAAANDRRRFIKGAGLMGLGVAGAALLGSTEVKAQAVKASDMTGSLTATDIAVLNFALNLEYLEAEFYTRAFYGMTLQQVGIPTSGTGTAGPTKGGAKVMFESGPDGAEFSGRLRAIAKQITLDEQTHVLLLRELLGSNAIAKPAINLDALGIGFANYKQFITLARDFEDVGVSAYGGAVGLLSSAALSYGARIALVEAYHASNLRLLNAENRVKTEAVDSLDVPPPPVGSQYFTTDNQALAVVRTTSQVLAIVYGNSNPGTSSGGFFPEGVNGSITVV